MILDGEDIYRKLPTPTLWLLLKNWQSLPFDLIYFRSLKVVYK